MRAFILLIAILMAGCASKPIPIDVGSVVSYQDKTYAITGIGDDWIEFMELEEE